MTKSASITEELKRMSMTELRKELALKRASYAKHRIGITMQSEKNHAACRLRRREIARMTMVQDQMEKESVRKPKNGSDLKQSSDSPISSGTSAEKPVKRVRSKAKKTT